MRSKWQGLWFQRQAVYAGPVIRKNDIPAFTRIVIRYNKNYISGSNRPRFVYCFMDSTDYEKMCVPLELQEKDDEIINEDDLAYTENIRISDFATW